MGEIDGRLVELPLDEAQDPGYWAPAYRFVKTATGQASDLIPLPLTTVTMAIAAGGSGKQKKAA